MALGDGDCGPVLAFSRIVRGQASSRRRCAHGRGSRPDTQSVGPNLPENESRDVRTPVRRAVRPEDLHICPSCDSPLVYPTEWSPVDAAHWRVELRCPECEWTESGLHEQVVLNRFDQILDSGTDSLVDDLRRLQRANMEDELERFGMALSSNLILPEDF